VLVRIVSGGRHSPRSPRGVELRISVGDPVPFGMEKRVFSESDESISLWLPLNERSRAQG